jgi:tripeptide aminopeptidase
MKPSVERPSDLSPAAERLVATFRELVCLDSPSYEEGRAADEIEARMRSLGMETWRDDTAAATGSDTGNLFGLLRGAEGMHTIALCAHMDTVEPGRGIRPVVEDGVIRSSGDTVLGADDKAAVAQILEGLATLQADGAPHGDILAVFTVAEEQSLVGSKAMDLSGLTARSCFVMDAHGSVGAAILASPGQNNVYATIRGKATHAGINPEDGVNAIAGAARCIERIRQGRLDKETTANVGKIQGGRATNIVPDLVEIAAEVRSHDAAKLARATEDMMAAFEAASELGCSAEVRMEPQYHAFAIAPDTAIVQLFERACAAIGVAPRLEVSGGGSDANVFNRAGIPALVLSCGMEQMHSTEEYVRVDQLVAGHDLVVALVAEASR